MIKPDVKPENNNFSSGHVLKDQVGIQCPHKAILGRSHRSRAKSE